ncbi:MAG: regulatory protein RecX [Gemmatimonadota bacterium]|nr:MAG: regulatory protein RecX [Gemmatimonadota bacterium]
MSEETKEEDRTLADASEVERRAVDAALNFLSYRQRTGQEVRRKLAERGFSSETIESAMGRLCAVSLVDDEAFVAAYVRDRLAHRPMGVRRMAQELYLKGIPRDVAQPVIERMLREEGADEWSLARRVVEKKRQTLSSRAGDRGVARRRLRDHLIRRGFESRVVREVVDELLPPQEHEAER